MAEKEERRLAEYVVYAIVTAVAVGMLLNIWLAVSHPAGA